MNALEPLERRPGDDRPSERPQRGPFVPDPEREARYNEYLQKRLCASPPAPPAPLPPSDRALPLARLQVGARLEAAGVGVGTLAHAPARPAQCAATAAGLPGAAGAQRTAGHARRRQRLGV